MEDNRSSIAKTTNTPAFLLLPAGGRGLRMGGGTPKQFRMWGGRPLIQATIEAFFREGMPAISEIALSVPPEWLEEVRGWHFPAPHRVVVGGDTRQESVQEALALLPDCLDVPVMIHDAVRPFPPAAPIREALEALATWDGAVLAEPSTDTLKQVDAAGRVEATLDRTVIFRAQTPQVARLGVWRDAFAWAKSAGIQGTDDVFLLEQMGLRVKVVASTPGNLKLTTPEDWDRLIPS